MILRTMLVVRSKLVYVVFSYVLASTARTLLSCKRYSSMLFCRRSLIYRCGLNRGSAKVDAIQHVPRQVQIGEHQHVLRSAPLLAAGFLHSGVSYSWSRGPQ